MLYSGCHPPDAPLHVSLSFSSASPRKRASRANTFLLASEITPALKAGDSVWNKIGSMGGSVLCDEGQGTLLRAPCCFSMESKIHSLGYSRVHKRQALTASCMLSEIIASCFVVKLSRRPSQCTYIEKHTVYIRINLTPLSILWKFIYANLSRVCHKH